MKFGKSMPVDTGGSTAPNIKLTPEPPVQEEESEDLIDVEYEEEVASDEPLYYSRLQLDNAISDSEGLHKKSLHPNEVNYYLNILKTGEEDGNFIPSFKVMAIARFLKENLNAFPQNVSSIGEDLIERELLNSLDLSVAYKEDYEDYLKLLRNSVLTADKVELTALPVHSSFSHPMLVRGLIPRRG